MNTVGYIVSNTVHIHTVKRVLLSCKIKKGNYVFSLNLLFSSFLPEYSNLLHNFHNSNSWIIQFFSVVPSASN